MGYIFESGEIEAYDHRGLGVLSREGGTFLGAGGITILFHDKTFEGHKKPTRAWVGGFKHSDRLPDVVVTNEDYRGCGPSRREELSIPQAARGLKLIHVPIPGQRDHGGSPASKRRTDFKLEAI